jgi:hypothetical protein
MQQYVSECYYLRNGEASNGETRDDIRTEKGEIIVRTPLENGEEKLKGKKKLGETWLVFETV